MMGSHGGSGYGVIVSIGVECLGKDLARCSSGMMQVVVVLRDAVALRIAALIGCVPGDVCKSRSVLRRAIPFQLLSLSNRNCEHHRSAGLESSQASEHLTSCLQNHDFDSSLEIKVPRTTTRNPRGKRTAINNKLPSSPPT